MLKISSSNAKNIIIIYSLKVIASTVLFITLLSILFSFVILKLDLPLDYCKYFSVVTCSLSSFFISYISIGSFKNNQLALSVISVVPLILFSVINYFIHGDNIALIFVKIILIVLLAFSAAYIRVKKK